MGILGNNKQNEEKLDSLIAGIFNNFYKQSNPEQVRAQLAEIILNKKGRTNSKIEYAGSLINNITYLVEIQKEWMRLIEDYLVNSIVTPSQFDNQLAIIANEVRQIVPQLSNKYKASYERFSNIDEKIDHLEFDYKFNSLYNNFVSLFLNVLVHNRDIYDQLRQNNVTIVTDLIMQYSAFYTNAFLKNIVGQR